MAEAPDTKGEFRLLHKIGEGGMADVFLAERMGDDGFRTRVALKRLHRGLAMDTYFIRQLVREARLLGQLEHANIVKVYDLRHIGDEYYVVMEYVDGIDLAAVARVHRSRKTRIPRPFFFHVALSLAEALTYAHAAVDPDGNPTPLIHRDLKPSNVMLSRRGVVKLTDFGIAHVGDGSVTGGLVQGTANYMSPEQAFGEERLTPASDVYSLGSVFYEMLTGKGLVDGDNYLKAIHQVRQRRVTVDELAEVGVEPGLRMVVAKMLAANIEQRYQEVDSVRNDLQFVADRLQVDLSWHRIRSYVGRLMGILGRAPDRATLSNLKVASEYHSGATNLAPPVAAEPEPSPPDALQLRRDAEGPVTQAVRKDLLDAPPPPEQSDPEAELVIGEEPSGRHAAFDDEEEVDTEETVADPSGGQVSARELLEKSQLRAAAAKGSLDEETAVAADEDWALGGAAPGGEANSGSWEEDDEETRIYAGQSPRQTGVVGTLENVATPRPIQVPEGEGASQIGPNPSGVTVAGPPSTAGRGSSDLWVFEDEVTSGVRASMPKVPASPQRPRKRRRKKKKKRKSTTFVLVTMFVLFLLAALIIILLTMKELGVPPFAVQQVPSTDAPTQPVIE